MTHSRTPQDDVLLHRVRDHLHGSALLFDAVSQSCLSQALSAARMVADAFAGNHTLLLCGNGGSAADCQHMAAEFMSCLCKEHKRRALPAIALTTDTSFLTAYSNDESFDGVFARQVEALGQRGDVLLGISTSGNSINVLLAMKEAKKRGLRTIALTGAAGGKIGDLADVLVAVPSTDTQHVQESHLALEHCICDVVEQILFS